MNIMKKLLHWIFPIFTAISLTACQASPPSASDEIKVGVISGPEAQLMEVAKKVALEKYGLKIKIIEFTDYAQPNAALNDGSIDANAFQHQPYLDQVIHNRGYKLVAVGKTFTYPMGVYSKKITAIDQIPNGATVAIPNDPSNEARALLLLSEAGLIHLNANASSSATLFDILSNPKNLNFKEIDAALLPKALNDVDLAIINVNYAIPAGLFPQKDAIFLESDTSPYANLVVVRQADANNPKFKQLVAALHSAEVIEAAKKIFKGGAIPAKD